MTRLFLTLANIAELGGHPLERLKGRVRNDTFPEPDAKVGTGEGKSTRYGWLPDTVAEYLPEDFSEKDLH